MLGKFNSDNSPTGYDWKHHPYIISRVLLVTKKLFRHPDWLI